MGFSQLLSAVEWPDRNPLLTLSSASFSLRKEKITHQKMCNFQKPVLNFTGFQAALLPVTLRVELKSSLTLTSTLISSSIPVSDHGMVSLEHILPHLLLLYLHEYK